MSKPWPVIPRLKDETPAYFEVHAGPVNLRCHGLTTWRQRCSYTHGHRGPCDVITFTRYANKVRIPGAAMAHAQGVGQITVDVRGPDHEASPRSDPR